MIAEAMLLETRYSTNFTISLPPSSSDDAPYLFGGTEDPNQWANYLHFYSNDINGDGQISPTTTFLGLNDLPWSSSPVILHSIFSKRCNYNAIPYCWSLDCNNNDDVVRCDRQVPTGVSIPLGYFKSFENSFNPVFCFPIDIVHNRAHWDREFVMRGLDEPNDRNTAYEIPNSTLSDSYISGFTTIQSEGGISDNDYYKFTATSTGNAVVYFTDIQNQNSWQLAVYNSPTASPIATVTNLQQPGNSAELPFSVTSGQTYFIGFTSQALSNSYLNPYKFKVFIQISISSVQFDQTIYSPGTVATLTVTLGNTLAGANVTFTCNSQTYTCTDMGGGVYIKTFIVPSTIGNYPVAVNASKAGFINAITFNTSVSVQNLGASPWPPYIQLTYPNNEVCHDECYIIWNDDDPDNNAVIYLYYDSNNSGLNGICINPNNPIFEDGGDAYIWNTVNMPEGIYWIYATINDGTTMTSDYSPGYIEINHPDPSTDFSYSSKNAEEDEGDGDGIIESGESFDLDIWIKNLSYVTTYNYVEAKLTTTNTNVTITNNEASYGNFTPRQTKKGDYDFDIQVANGYVGNVAFKLNLEFKDENGYMFYQVLNIPNIYISANVSPSFQVIDVQIIDDGNKCNNDGILQSGENSIDYKLKLLNNGSGTAYEVRGEATLPPEFNTSLNGADYPDIPSGNSAWPVPDDHCFLSSIPYDFTGIINAELNVTWGNELFSQLIPFTLEVFPAPRLKYDPETYDFGIKELGDTAVTAVTLINMGTADLIISQIENLSANPNNWISGCTFPITISPEDTVIVYINIKRDLQSNVNDIFRIHSNNHAITTHDILISGTFYQPIPQGYVQVWSSDPLLNQGGEWVEPADLDNDGLIDVVTFWRANLYVWEQTQANSLEFTLKFTYAIPGTEVYIMSLRIGNCDGDNKIDIVIREQDEGVTPMTARMRVFETSGNDQYTQVWSQTISTSYMDCTEVGNCDADVYDEIIIYSGSGTVYVYNRTGNNTYSTTWNSGTTITNYGASKSSMGYMTTGDTDQDGNKEIIFPGDDTYMFIWEKNTSGTGYTLVHDPVVTFNPSPQGSEVYPKVYDIDNDNTNEIIISGDGEGFQFSVFNPITWTYEFHNSTGLYDEFSSPAIADLNGNGNLEVFMGEDGSGVKRMIVYEYSNGSYFETFVSPNFGDDIYNIKGYDLDNDGVQELILSVSDHFRIWRYEPPLILPDLQIAANNISFSNPEPTDNDTIIVSALIRNIGTVGAENIPVEFFHFAPSFGIRIDSLAIHSLNMGNDSLISIQWIPNQSGSSDIYVVVDRNNIIDELDTTNNISYKSISILDNDTIPPFVLSHTHTELFGDNDGYIEDDEFIRFDWNLFDESGIDSTYILFNNSIVLNGLLNGGGNFYASFTNQVPGLYPYEIHAIDNDNSQMTSIVYDTILIIQHAPHIISNYPVNNAISVSLTDSIVVEFDIPMNSSSINSNTFLVFKADTTPVNPLSVVYHLFNQTAVFDPGILESGVEYQALILSGSNGVKDINNNNLESTYIWSFTTMEEPLSANFIASTTNTSPGREIGFTDLSTGNPDSWYWTFGDGSTSTLTNPSHIYISTGSYTVSLTVTSSAGCDTMTKNNYITIQVKTWAGNISNDWSNPGNWIPVGVPLSTDNIFIPTTATFMPIVQYDGYSVNNVTLSGALTINPVFKLTINGTLTIKGFCSSFIDTRNSKFYNTVLIGGQCWMKENLNLGTMISGLTNQLNNDTIEKYCFDNLESNCDIYGGFYQWNELMQYNTSPGLQGICPQGWHVPTDGEWCTLTHFIDSTLICNENGLTGTNAGGKMKETGNNHWISPNTGATNESGFTALGSGYRRDTTPVFGTIGSSTFFWSSTEYSPSNAWYRGLGNDIAGVYRYGDYYTKSGGFSVRCIKD